MTPDRFVPSSEAPLKFAFWVFPDSVAPSKTALTNVASRIWALVRFAFVKFAPVAFVARKFALVKFAEKKLVFRKVVLRRFVPTKLAFDRFELLPFDPVWFSPLWTEPTSRSGWFWLIVVAFAALASSSAAPRQTSRRGDLMGGPFAARGRAGWGFSRCLSVNAAARLRPA